MRTTSRKLIRLSPLIVAPLVLGCGTAPASAPEAAGGARLNADVRGNDGFGEARGASTPFLPDEDESPYAAQAQSDADWLAARRRARELAAAPTATAEPVPPPSGPTARPREVHFNDPGGALAARPPVREPGPGAEWSTPTAGSAVGASGTAEPTRAGAADPATTRTADSAAPPPADAPPVLATPEPRLPDDAALRAGDDFSTLLVRLRRELTAQAIRSPQPVRELAAYLAMALIEPDLQLPADAVAGLTDEEREDLEHLLSFFARLGRELGADGHADEVLRAAVLELQDAIARQPEIDVLDAQLCWRVESFGRYDAFEKPAFLAGEAQQVIVYLALGRFSSRATEKGQWLVELAEQLEIYPAGGAAPVWSEGWTRIVDEAGTRRQDFYTVWLVELPKRLAPGSYVLKVRVRDEQSGAEAETSLPFDMVVDPKRVSRVPGQR